MIIQQPVIDYRLLWLLIMITDYDYPFPGHVQLIAIKIIQNLELESFIHTLEENP